MAANAAAEQAPAEGKKRSPMMLIIGVVVVLGLGGFFGYVKFMKKDAAATGEGSARVVAEKPMMQDWDTFLVNLADPGGKRYLKINIKVELSGAQAQVEFTDKNVPLRDTVITLLSSKEYDDIASAEGKAGLKREILVRLNKIMRPDSVKQVYFTDFLVQ